MPRTPVQAFVPIILTALAVGASACATGGPERLIDQSAHELPPEQDAFWTSLLELCGMAFEGTDEDVYRVMHVRQCYPDEIRIPLHVDGNRSRTWILTRQPDGIRLKHDHRYEDGREEEVTQYGGDTEDAGTATRQTFPADAFTREVIGEMVRGAENNIWRMEIEPGETFAYRLTRGSWDGALRWAFDLTNPIVPPPAPWGYEDTEPTH